MTRPNRWKSAGRIIGKGEVTPIQVAFLVDRYLCDNRFSKTRSVFRSEASSLISNSPVRDVPNSLIPLDEILNEYIRLKKEKVMLDQEKAKLDQEKTRIQNLLHGMQDVMNVYNSTALPPTPPAIPAAAPTNIQIVASSSKQNNFGVSPSVCTVYKTPHVMAVALPGNKRVGNFTAPSSSQSITKKRKSPEVSLGAPSVSLGATSVSKKAGMKTIQQADKVTNHLTFESSSDIQTTPVSSSVANESYDLTPSVSKCLFNKSDMSPPSNSACLRTPQKQVSPQSDTSITPQQEVTPTNCTIVTTERITVSPLKQIASYTVERSHMVSSFSPVKSDSKMSSKRDHVKGRLNFDDTDATMHLDAPVTTDLVSASSSGSETEADLFDIDFSNMELLSEDFPFSELLNDFDLGCEGMHDSCLPQPSNSFIETASGSAPESTNPNLLPDQVVSEYTSTVTEMIQEKDMNTQGSDSMTTVKSITKCLRILSPVKKCRQSHS